MRAFIAFSLPNEIRDRLVSIQDDFRSMVRRASWTRFDSMHLTLRFLSDISEDELRWLKGGLDNICKSEGPFPVKLGSVGVFPSGGLPRVLKVSLSGTDKVLNFQKRIEEMVQVIGIEGEIRAWIPHMTLARLKNIEKSTNFRRKIENYKSIGTEFKLQNVQLIESKLMPQGAVHNPLHEIELQ